jgi:hypothetical protein
VAITSQPTLISTAAIVPRRASQRVYHSPAFHHPQFLPLGRSHWYGV